jgi:hypothetical protein
MEAVGCKDLCHDLDKNFKDLSTCTFLSRRGGDVSSGKRCATTASNSGRSWGYISFEAILRRMGS